MWCIPAQHTAAFVCQMEAVLAVYQRPTDPAYPVVCMDETSVQCTREVRAPIPAQAGQSERYDVEYERNGVAHLIAFYAPFENWRRVDVATNHAAAHQASRATTLPCLMAMTSPSSSAVHCSSLSGTLARSITVSPLRAGCTSTPDMIGADAKVQRRFNNQRPAERRPSGLKRRWP